ncbi:MAG: cation transporter [Planctomycetes bacterium]|nr:cation transporter [Planctomycetota bacterium]
MATGSKKVIYAAAFGNGGIAITKFIAASITGSGAMLAEAIHSVVDTTNQLLLLWGIRQSNRPPSKAFPLGHGKEIYFWSFVVAILIFAVGSGVSLYEGVKRTISPHPVENVTVNYIVLSIAMVFEGAAWWYALRAFREVKGKRSYLEAAQSGKDPTLFVVLLEDSAALIGLVVAMIGIALGQLTGIQYFDGIATIVIGVVLAMVACFMAWETKGLLIGESAEPEVEAKIRDIVSQDARIDSINELITIQMGPHHLLVNLSVHFKADLSSGAVEEAVTACNRKIKEAIPIVHRVFIEAESWSAHRAQQCAHRHDESSEPADSTDS